MTIALELLFEHLDAGSTGELVAATDVGEVRVFIHRGRLAWGQAAGSPFSLRAYLLSRGTEEAHLDRAVTAGLQRRGALSEVLVDSGLVPRALLREALALQLRGAVEALAQAGHSFFVAGVGRVAEYELALTFSWEELKAASRLKAPVSRATNRSAERAVAEVLAEVPGLAWLVATVRGEVHQAMPSGTAAPPWAAQTLGRGAWLAMLRLGPQTTLGVRTRFGELWGAGAFAQGGVGAALNAFRARALLRTLRPMDFDGHLHAVGPHADHPALQRLVADEALVYAAGIVGPGGEVSALARLGWLVGRMTSLLPDYHALLQGTEPDQARLTVADDAGLWCGAPVRAGPDHSVWVLAGEQLKLGMAHTLLSALEGGLGALRSPGPQGAASCSAASRQAAR